VRAKPPSQSAAAESQTERTTISLHVCERKKKKRISLAKLQSRKGFPDFNMQAFPSFKFTSINF
jgi:hypothetical protein